MDSREPAVGSVHAKYYSASPAASQISPSEVDQAPLVPPSWSRSLFAALSQLACHTHENIYVALIGCRTIQLRAELVCFFLSSASVETCHMMKFKWCTTKVS